MFVLTVTPFSVILFAAGVASGLVEPLAVIVNLSVASFPVPPPSTVAFTVILFVPVGSSLAICNVACFPVADVIFVSAFSFPEIVQVIVFPSKLLPSAVNVVLPPCAILVLPAVIFVNVGSAGVVLCFNIVISLVAPVSPLSTFAVTVIFLSLASAFSALIVAI